MKKKWLLFLFAIILLITLQTSCHKEGANVSVSSAHGSTKSHNMGADCMSCHKKNGKGAGGGWYVIAGSVFKPDMINMNPNATIHLYTAQNGGGVEVAKIEADAYGNFYTTNAIDFGGGLYPAVESSSGTIHYMNSFTNTGECNGCHSSSSVQAGRIFGD